MAVELKLDPDLENAKRCRHECLHLKIDEFTKNEKLVFVISGKSVRLSSCRRPESS